MQRRSMTPDPARRGRRGEKFMPIMAALAASAALVACSGQESTGDNENPEVTPAAAVAVPGGAGARVTCLVAVPDGAASEGRLPPAPYRAYFEERYPVPAKAVSAAEVQAMLASQGPQQTVAALWGEGEDNGFEAAMRGIAMGDPAWLEVAPELAPGVDAGASTSVAMATQDALTTSAEDALRLMSLWDGASCTYEGYEVPPEQSQAFYAAAIPAVEAVNDPELEALKAECLAQMRSDGAQ